MDIPLNASKLDLSGLGLTAVPDNVFLCRNLKKLNLSNNKIAVIPIALSKLKQLKNLDLSDNGITALYAKNFEFKRLEVLVLRNNKLKKLPRQIGQLDKLKTLNLSGNQIEVLPEEISKLEQLTELGLSNNKFTVFPLQILKFEQLRSLWVSNNPLTNFPVNQIAAELHALSALYCFSPMNNSGVDSNYQQLQSKKGNGIGLLHLLALKEKPKAAISRHVAKTPGKKSLFISYSHADLEWLTKIELALQTMKYEGLAIDSWNDTRIRAGDLWKKEIENAIGKADVAILLISTSFLASKFIREEEVPPLLKKAEEQGTKILPIIVGLCRFTQSVLKSYQAVNKPEKPLNALSVYEQDKVIYDLTLEIDKVFENL